jgi:ankyrin repeat protein
MKKKLKQLNDNVLHYAAYQGSGGEIIKILIDAGADPLAVNAEAKTPVDFANQNNKTTTALYIEQFISYQRQTKSANFNV